jgi:hypothetical protein
MNFKFSYKNDLFSRYETTTPLNIQNIPAKRIIELKSNQDSSFVKVGILFFINTLK